MPRKQRSDHDHWRAVVDARYRNPDVDNARRCIQRAVDRITRWRELGGPVAYGWSGGKDSQALRIVCEAADVAECVLVISELEYPAFLAWATDHMPWGLTVEARPLDLAWLARNPTMLFPEDAATAGRWFAAVQHAGQRAYCRREGIGVFLLGRRAADGNVIPDGGAIRDRQGWWKASPMHDWSHEDLLDVLGAHQAPLPPCYRWPRGFRVGTGPWPARQWTTSRQHGWSEVHQIDARIVLSAAEAGIPGAAEFLAGDG